jgi:hypothetical protein
MLKQCTFACQAIVFLSIVFLIGYIVLKNDKKVENFTDKQDQLPAAELQSKQIQVLQAETIKTVYRNYLNRDPTEEEIMQMSRVMKDPQDIASIVDAVKALDEYTNLILPGEEDSDMQLIGIKSSQMLKDLHKADADIRMNMYRDVIAVYQKTLERMPTNNELVYYTHRLLSDNAFDLIKLERILEGSNEYSILSKNQINIVNGQLSGNLTDAQLSMEVTDKYTAVFGQAPTLATLVFLKNEYIAFKLDSIKFNNLLLLLKLLEASDYVTDESGSITLQLSDAASDAYKKAALKRKLFNSKNMPNNVAVSGSGAGSGAGSSTASGTTPVACNSGISGEEMAPLLSGVQPTNASSTSTNAVSKIAKNDALYSRLSNLATQSCKFESDVFFDRDLYSEYQSNRNNDEMNFACKRSQYPDLDGDIIKTYGEKKINPRAQPFNAQAVKYSIEPDYAAPLSEATAVGSIMPPFIFSEITTQASTP